MPTSFQYNDVYNDLAFQWVQPADVASVGEGDLGWKVPLAEVDGVGDEVL